MSRLVRTFVLRSDQQAQGLWAFLKANWRAFADRGVPLAITVTEHKSKRSIEQNKRYWALLNELAAAAWVGGRQFNAEAWHEYFKRKFIGYEELPGGETAGISSTTLDVGEFSAYMERIEAHASTELGVEFDHVPTH